MGVDVFIHPEVERSHRSRRYRAYEDDLYGALRASDLPLLVKGGYAGRFSRNDRFAYRLASEQVGDGRKALGTGFVCREHWSALAQLLDAHRNEEWRLHGTYAERCVVSFAAQALCYLATGERLGVGTPAMGHPELAMLECEGGFARSSLRLGTVMSEYRPGTQAGRPWAPWLLKVLPERWIAASARHGDATYQMMDDRTRMHYA